MLCGIAFKCENMTSVMEVLSILYNYNCVYRLSNPGSPYSHDVRVRHA